MADTRKRLTARGYDPKTGSFGKSADPYLMNQPRRPGSEPGVTQYESGNPSTWAEDPTPVDTWKQEYEKGRNEVGMGNFLDSTWKDREQMPPSAYDKAAADAALKQATQDRQAQFAAAKKIAKKALHLSYAMFPGAGDDFVHAQARDFMSMGEDALDATIARITNAGKDKHEEGMDEEDEGMKHSTDLSVASLRAELEDIKQAADADQHRDLIATLETRIASLEGGDAAEVTASDDSDSRLAALTSGLDTLLNRTAGDDEGDDDDDDDDSDSDSDQDEKDDEGADDEGASNKEASKTASADSEYTIELGAPEMDGLPGNGGDLLDDIFTAAENGKTASDKRGVSKLGGGSKTANSNGIGDLSNLWKSDPDVSGDFR